MNARSVDCRAAAAQVEGKLEKIKLLLKSKASSTVTPTRIRRPRRVFIDVGAVELKHQEHVVFEDISKLSNDAFIEHVSPGAISPNTLQDIDGAKVKVEKIASNDDDQPPPAAKCLLDGDVSQHGMNKIIANEKLPSTFETEKQCIEPIEITARDENKCTKIELISSCEDKVIRLKELLSSRKKKTARAECSSDAISESIKTEKYSKAEQVVLDNLNASKDDNLTRDFAVKELDHINAINATIDTVKAEFDIDKDNNKVSLPINKDSLDVKPTEINTVVRINSDCESDNSFMALEEGSPDSCYASTDQPYCESYNESSDFDSDSDSGRGKNLLECCLANKFSTTFNDLTDESLYDENTLLNELKTFSDSDEEIECGLSTICEDAELTDQSIDQAEDFVDKLQSILVGQSRKQEKKTEPLKQVSNAEYDFNVVIAY